MAHMINQTARGASAAFAIKPAWHNLGAVIDHVMTWEEIYRAALLDFDIQKRPIYDQDPITGAFREINTHMGTYRMDSGVRLGVVGNDYQVVQNADVFSFVDTLIGASNGAHYESAGALRKGERIWVLARIPEADITVGGNDTLQSYLLGLTSHDGSLANQFKVVKTRVVCQNTLTAALSEKGSFWRFKHTLNVQQQMKLAAEAAEGLVRSAKEMEARLNRLAHIQLRKETFAGILDRLFPATKEGSSRRDKIVLKVIDLFEQNDGNAFKEQRGTAYNLLNAVTNYADHERGIRKSEQAGGPGISTEQLRAENALFGGGMKLKESALAVIEAVTADEPETTAAQTFVAPVSDSDFLKSLGIKGDLNVD